MKQIRYICLKTKGVFMVLGKIVIGKTRKTKSPTIKEIKIHPKDSRKR